MIESNFHTRHKSTVLHLEEEARYLRQILHGQTSERIRSAAFIRFFDWLSLQPEQGASLSFYIEFRHWLTTLSQVLPLIGWDPARNESYIDIIHRFAEAMPGENLENLAEAEKRARVLAAAGYLMLGQVQDACRLLSWELPVDGEALPTEYQEAMRILEYGLEHSLPYSSELKSHLKDWMQRRGRFSADVLSVLLVDPSMAGERQEGEEGLLLELAGRHGSVRGMRRRTGCC